MAKELPDLPDILFWFVEVASASNKSNPHQKSPEHTSDSAYRFLDEINHDIFSDMMDATLELLIVK